MKIGTFYCKSQKVKNVYLGVPGIDWTNSLSSTVHNHPTLHSEEIDVNLQIKKTIHTFFPLEQFGVDNFHLVVWIEESSWYVVLYPLAPIYMFISWLVAWIEESSWYVVLYPLCAKHMFLSWLVVWIEEFSWYVVLYPLSA